MSIRERMFKAGYAQGYEQGAKDLERYYRKGKGASLKQRLSKVWVKFKSK